MIIFLHILHLGIFLQIKFLLHLFLYPYFAPIIFHKKYYKSCYVYHFTLFCQRKYNNTTVNTFPVNINKDQLVGYLKDTIKVKNKMTLLYRYKQAQAIM